MSDVDNLFDAALSRADEMILGLMGTVVLVTSGSMAGGQIIGVFDDPDNVAYTGGGVRIEGSSPALFVKSVDAGLLQRADTLTINGVVYWIDRIGPDDGGSRHLWLGTGTPPVTTRRR